MKLLRALPVLIMFLSKASYASKQIESSKETGLPTVLKADNVDGDKVENIITATGNVEVRKGNGVIFADKINL